MNAGEIKKIILAVAKCKFTLNATTKEYQINGQDPNELPDDFYNMLYSDYETRLKKQVKEKWSDGLYKKYLSQIVAGIDELKEASEKYRVSYLFSKSKGHLSERAYTTHERIEKIHVVQKKVLTMMKDKLEYYVENKEFQISSDFTNELTITEPRGNDITGVLPLNRAIFALSKADVIMLFYLLEQSKLLSFEGDVHRNRFIEQNFMYTEIRSAPNKNEVLPISGVNTGISRLRSNTPNQKKTNRKLKEKLISLLNDKLESIKF